MMNKAVVVVAHLVPLSMWLALLVCCPKAFMMVTGIALFLGSATVIIWYWEVERAQ